MPPNRDRAATHARQEFCLALKAARERKGITLAEIAHTTKIPASVFAALERNDLRRWPKGLFRRSFFRDYVRMIGLPVTDTCAEFVQFFPDDEGATLTKRERASDEANQANGVRMVLDAAWRAPRVPARSRMLAALIDAAAVILVAAALVWVAGVNWLAPTTIGTLAYFSLATALLGESPATWAMSRSRSILDALTPGPAIAAARRRVALVLRTSAAWTTTSRSRLSSPTLPSSSAPSRWRAAP